MTMAKKGKEKSVTEVIPKPASDVIKEIEDTFLNHRVLVYTAGRSIGFWDIPPMFRILEKLGKQKQLSIILQNRGGYMDDAFKMANVIHEFAEEVTFIIPSYANSAATLLCLSGNKLLMGTISELGPTNPMMIVQMIPMKPSFA